MVLCSHPKRGSLIGEQVRAKTHIWRVPCTPSAPVTPLLFPPRLGQLTVSFSAARRSSPLGQPFPPSVGLSDILGSRRRQVTVASNPSTIVGTSDRAR